MPVKEAVDFLCSMYLDFAIPAFRLTHSGVKPETQIHTHMFYSEFTDIIPTIDDMDAQVIDMLTLQETIRPSADLRNHYSEISKLCKENKEAVIITVNGRVAPITETFDDLRKISK